MALGEKFRPVLACEVGGQNETYPAPRAIEYNAANNRVKGVWHLLHILELADWEIIKLSS